MTFKERDDMLLAVIRISELNLLKTNDVRPFHVPNQSCNKDSSKILGEGNLILDPGLL